MNFFGMFRKAAPVREPSQAPASPKAVFYKNSQKVLVFDNVTSAHQAITHPVVQRCLRMIGRAAQVVPWKAEAIPGEKASSKELKALTSLLRFPNDDLTSANMRYWLALSMAAYGRAPFSVSRGTLGFPNGLYPLDAKYVSVLVNSRGKIQEYEYGASSENKQRFPIRSRSADGSYAFQIQSPGLSGDPANAKDQLIPLNSIGGASAVVLALMRRTLATASGHPNSKYIIAAESSLTQPQLDEIEEYVEDHETFGDRSGEVIFLRGTKVEVHKLDANMSDIHSKVPMDDMSRMIFGAFGIPIALAGLGAADAARYASNFSESRASFYSDTVIPEYLSPIADGLTQALCAPDSGIQIKFDIDAIPAMVPERIIAAERLASVEFLSNDEKRSLVGFGPRKKEEENEPTGKTPPPDE